MFGLHFNVLTLLGVYAMTAAVTTASPIDVNMVTNNTLLVKRDGGPVPRWHIWKDNGPEIDDIEPSKFKDDWFLAAVAEVIWQNPQRIKDVFINMMEYDIRKRNIEDVVTIKLRDVKHDKDVEKALGYTDIKDGFSNHEKVWWVAALQYVGKHITGGKGFDKDLEDNQGAQIGLEMILGQKAELIIPGDKDAKSYKGDIWRQFERVNNGGYICNRLKSSNTWLALLKLTGKGFDDKQNFVGDDAKVKMWNPTDGKQFEKKFVEIQEDLLDYARMVGVPDGEGVKCDSSDCQ